MAGASHGLDDAETIRRFIEAMNQQPAGNVNNWGEAPQSGTTNLEASEDVDSSKADDGESPTTSPTPTPAISRSRIGSDAIQPTPSPKVKGLQPPQNTPQAIPKSPFVEPQHGKLPDDEDMNQLVFNIASNIKGKPLSESKWARKSDGWAQYGKKSTTTTRDLTPTKVVEFDPSVHESFERMSFKAADPDLEGSSIIGDEALIRKSSQPVLDDILAKKLEALSTEQPLLTDTDTDVAADTKTLSPDRDEGDHLFNEEKKTGSGKLLQLDGGRSDGASTVQLDTVIHSGGSLWNGSDDAQLSKTGEFESSELHTSKSSRTSSLKDSEPTQTPKADTLPPHLKYLQTSPKASMRGSESTQTSMKNVLPPHLRSRQTFAEDLQRPVQRGQSSDDINLIPKDLPSGIGEDNRILNNRRVSKSLARGASTFPTRALSPSKENEDPSCAGKQTSTDELKKGAGDTEQQGLRKLMDVKQNAPRPSEKPEASGPVSASPVKASNSKSENLENQLFFNAWPKLEPRDRPTAEVRTIIIKSLPSTATPTFVTSLLSGTGPLDRIHVNISSEVSATATIRFLHAADAALFYDRTSNGLIYGYDAQENEQIAWVERGADVDVVGGLLTQWIASGVTRCVRAVPVDKDIPREQLEKMAERKGRKLEGIEDGVSQSGVSRRVVWRFCDIAHAVQFKAALARDEEWETCNVTFGDDPCGMTIPASQ